MTGTVDRVTVPGELAGIGFMEERNLGKSKIKETRILELERWLSA